jgi:uroporphyrin-III C-methyltransferase/precorrin-2 dehydrogenase/sirohydrochlorin ferrochelatase
MGVAQMPRIVERLTGAGASPDHPAALIERGSLADQRVIRGTLGTIVELSRKHDVQPPALLIIGEVASLAKGIDDGDNGLVAVLRANEASAPEPV